jgi:carbonic anhydrase
MTRSLLLPVLLLAACGAPRPAAPAPTAHWSYEGDEGPARWGSLAPGFATCTAGHRQSPIDLAGAAPDGLDPLTVAYAPQRTTLRNNGHTVQADFPAGSVVTVGGERLELLQYHLHTPSEHTVDGAHYPAELHLVHRGPRGLSVLGVLIREGAANPAYAPLLDRLPDAAGESRAVPGDQHVEALLPRSLGRVYRYDGSLTTPPCSEGVDWRVFAEPVELSAGQIAQLERVLHHNSRPTQPRGARGLRIEGAE